MIFVCALLFSMFRVVQVTGTRTIVVDFAGKVNIVTLRDVQVAAEDEKEAAVYLRKALADRWVYIENGDVYRSPDGLFINDAMRRRAWLGMTILGHLDPLPRPAKKLPVKTKRRK